MQVLYIVKWTLFSLCVLTIHLKRCIIYLYQTKPRTRKGGTLMGKRKRRKKIQHRRLTPSDKNLIAAMLHLLAAIIALMDD